ncbi:hypothetical protein Pmani_040270 [Petrolisthes manimaculis]|uniref:Fibronectin type-III domain-containing protein n=1 Tax=Petrolisthes manimaculis TaxID=1843537 RepID=A0AAE1TKH2_9EUCA|nr:hypothetical protein Pmani_040270 [Petrolisthes manimaculis]
MPAVKLVPLSPTELHVSWEPLNLSEARGPIIEQELQWRKKSHYYELKTLDVNITQFTIEGLQPSKRYEVRVLVSTEVGYPPHQNQLEWESVKMLRADEERDLSNRPFFVHLCVSSRTPTRIKVDWDLEKELVENVQTFMITYNRTLVNNNNNHNNNNLVTMPSNATSHLISDLAPNTCYSVMVLPKYTAIPEDGVVGSTGGVGNSGGGVGSITNTICTLPLLPTPHLPNLDLSPRLGVKKVKIRVLNTTSIIIHWRPRRRKVIIEFFTVRVLSLGDSNSNRAAGTDGYELLRRKARDGRNGIDKEAVLPPDSGGDTHIQRNGGNGGNGGNQTPEAEAESPRDEQAVRYIRVTQPQATLADLKPLHTYEVTVTASTVTLTSHPSTSKRITTKEGVPTVPLNVSYHPMSPKDVTLSWTRPRLTNGRLTAFLVTYSHNLVEWRNMTLPAHLTNVEIEDLVSNTNYTLKIAGVTGGGIGAYTTIYVYISATLILSPSVSTELMLIIVVGLITVVLCVTVGVLYQRKHRITRQTPSVFQGNGSCRIIYANGTKCSAARDHGGGGGGGGGGGRGDGGRGDGGRGDGGRGDGGRGDGGIGTELHDYKPVLASLPPTTQPHHLDTKGGPGIQDDSLVANNSIFDPTPMQMNQTSGTGNTTHHDHHHDHDSITNHQHHQVLATLDDLDEGNDDASRHLLQNTSSLQPVFSPSSSSSSHSSPSSSSSSGSSSSKGGVIDC